MNNGEFYDDLLDATMKQIYEKFGKPGAHEEPPRNYRCGNCGRWFTAIAGIDLRNMPIHECKP